MSSVVVWERSFSEVKIKRDPDEMLSFIAKHLKTVLGDSVEGILRVSYGGAPGLMVVGRYRDSRYEVLVVISGSSPRAKVVVSGAYAAERAERIAAYVENLIYTFAVGGDKGIFYFVLIPGLSLVPPKAESKLFKALQGMFLGNMVFIFAVSILISYAVYMTLGPYLTPIALVLMQIPLMLLAPYIMAGILGDWRLDRLHRFVYLVGVKVPIESYRELLSKIFMPKRYEIKRRIYEAVAGREDVDREYINALLASYGLKPGEYELEIKKIDVYGLVERVTAKYGLKTPSVYIANIIVPNAGATGLYPLTAAIFITTGLLTRLSEKEVEAVIGHELSHLKNWDVLTLFLLGAAEYLTRVYVLTTFRPFFPPGFALVYLFFSLTVFFFLAKIIETRADIEAAVRLNLPLSLSSALEKLGLTRIVLEKSSSGRLMYWLFWKPHPPTLFRIETLKKIAERGCAIGSPWIAAIKFCIKDFLKSLTGRG